VVVGPSKVGAEWKRRTKERKAPTVACRARAVGETAMWTPTQPVSG